MKFVKIYACAIGQSAWGNGGESFYYTDKSKRDSKLVGVHPMDNPQSFDFDAAEIEGLVYFIPERLKITT